MQIQVEPKSFGYPYGCVFITVTFRPEKHLTLPLPLLRERSQNFLFARRRIFGSGVKDCGDNSLRLTTINNKLQFVIKVS